MSQPSFLDVPNMNFPVRLEESGWLGVGRARNIKTDASHPMYKLNRQEYARCWYCRFFCHRQMVFCVILRMRPHFTRRRSGSWSSFRQTQHNRKPWICMQGARNIRKESEEKNKTSPEFSGKNCGKSGNFKKAFIQTAYLLGYTKKKRLKLG